MVQFGEHAYLVHEDGTGFAKADGGQVSWQTVRAGSREPAQT